MSRRVTVAMAIAAFAAATVLQAENAPDRVCTPDGVAHLVPARDELTALFARSESHLVIDTETGEVAPMGPPDVLMARIDSDGKVVVVCVDSEVAARRFLEAPVESLSKARVK